MDLGECRAGNGALGFATVISAFCVDTAAPIIAGVRVSPSQGTLARRAAYLLCTAAASGMVLLSGCSSIGGFTGAAAGIASGAATSNPAVGIAVGVAVQAATDAAIQKVFRDMQHKEQELIASYAGAMNVGDRRAWAIHYTFSFGDERGELMVTREIDNALAQCKEVALSVDPGKKDVPASWFITQVCQQTDGHWAWAAAEPATGRWGTLQ